MSLIYLHQFLRKNEWKTLNETVINGSRVAYVKERIRSDGSTDVYFFIGIVQKIDKDGRISIYQVEKVVPDNYRQFEDQLHLNQNLYFSKKGYLSNEIDKNIHPEKICSFKFNFLDEFLNFWDNMPFCVEMTTLESDSVRKRYETAQFQTNARPAYKAWYNANRIGKLIVKYMFFGYLQPRDKIKTGFFDVGRANLRSDFSTNFEDYLQSYNGNREIILITNEEKNWMDIILSYTLQSISMNNQEKVLLLARLIDEKMGQNCSDSESQNNIRTISSKNHSGFNIVSLFEIEWEYAGIKVLLSNTFVTSLAFPVL